jgi:hypothetical protein
VEETPSLGDVAAGAGGGEVAALASPNMFGDAFGAGTTLLRFTQTSTRPFNTTLMGRFTGFQGSSNPLTSSTTTFQGVALGTVSFALPPNTTVPVAMMQLELPNVPLLENLSVSSTIGSIVALPGETLLFLSAAGINGQALPPGANSRATYDVALQYLLQQQSSILVIAPNPSGGGVVGRTKISDDNNPLPRDRVIFNFDYFDNVPLSLSGTDVRRYSPGFEKTFFHQMASIEVRFPFASTLSSDIVADGITGSQTEFGNLHLTLKALLYSSEMLHVASGLGIALPTGDDTKVSLASGTPLVHIKNDAVILTPYIAALLTPGERFFAQAWLQAGIDANGNPVSVNPALAGLRPAGRLTDQTLLQTDVQLGYWLVRNSDPDRLLRGLAPFVELHYNTTISDSDVIQAGNFTIGASSDLNELNLSAGVIAQLGDNLNVSAGIVSPLKSSPDRFFDYQIGVRASYFFGPTARSRSAAAQVSGF